MALDFLKDTLNIISAFGKDDNSLNLENLALRNIKLRRELSEPSAYQQKVVDDKIARQKDIFSTIKDLSLDTRVSDATRNYYGKLLEYQYFGLPNEYRAILRPLTQNTPMDEQERKKQFFDRHYGGNAPQMPTDEKGNPLERIANNEAIWAKYDIEASEFNYQKNLFLFGKDFAETNKPPRFFQPVSYVGEGENRKPGDYWYRDKATGQIMNVAPTVSLVNQSDLEKWGWTMAKVRATGHVPTAEPIKATYGMNKVQITPVMDMITGQTRQDVEVYGPTEETIKNIPDNFLVALGELGKGTDFDEVNNGAVSDIMRHLTEYKDTYGDNPNPQALNALNVRLHSLYPDMRNYRLVLGPKDKGNAWWRNMLNMPGSEWSIIPVTETITVYDSEGSEGKVYKDTNSGKVHAASGAEIPMAKGAKQGDTINSITFGQSPQQVAASEEDIRKVMKWMNVTRGQAIAIASADKEKRKELVNRITTIPKTIKEDIIAFNKAHTKFWDWLLELARSTK